MFCDYIGHEGIIGKDKMGEKEKKGRNRGNRGIMFVC